MLSAAMLLSVNPHRWSITYHAMTNAIVNRQSSTFNPRKLRILQSITSLLAVFNHASTCIDGSNTAIRAAMSRLGVFAHGAHLDKSCCPNALVQEQGRPAVNFSTQDTLKIFE
jgi:hypothetical protein